MTSGAGPRVQGETARRMNSGNREGGFTYLGVLLLVGVIAVAAAATAEAWSHSRQRDKETQLLWIGEQYRQAIGLYYQRTPGSAKRYPETLEDLLEDRRFRNKQRYLRRIYKDPMNGLAEWGLIRALDGGIAGVHSLSEKRAIRQIAVGSDGRTAGTYRDWRFVYQSPESPVRASIVKPHGVVADPPK